MSTRATTYSTQIGQWDQPQIISFDSLFWKYSIESNFDQKEIAKINDVVNQWKPIVQKFIHQQESYFRPCLSDHFEMNNSQMNITITVGAAHIEHVATPNFVYKTQYQSSALNPLANTLRAPMANIMSDVIILDGLTDLGVPKKGLATLCSKDEISSLNENTINDAFVVCAEKINALSRLETLAFIREMPTLSQESIANQCCMLIKKTGASNFNWNNLHIHQTNHKLYSLDTQPLDGELVIDKLGNGFKTCRKQARISLRERAKKGLDLFHGSSNIYELSTFEDVAQSFLEKMD